MSAAAGNGQNKISLVIHALEHWNGRWILVLDNYDDPRGFPNIKRCIPTSGRGSILVTSRNKGLDRLGTLLDIPPLTTEEGVNLLLRGYQDIQIKDHMSEGSAIIKRLGCLALAIDQAASYLQYTKLPIGRLADFLPSFEARCQKILHYTPKNFWEYGTIQIHGKEEQNQAISAFTTWEMSFQLFGLDEQQKKNDKGHFMTLAAFLDPSNISETMFRYFWEAEWTQTAWMHIFTATNDVPGVFDRVTPGEQHFNSLDMNGQPTNGELLQESMALQNDSWSSERFWNLLTEAFELSLFESLSHESDGQPANFSLHPLIRDWLQLRELLESRRRYLEESIDLVVCCIVRFESITTTPYQKGLLIAHLDACLLNDRRYSETQNTLGQHADNLMAAVSFADFYQDHGRYEISEQLLRLSLETSKKVWGSKNLKTLNVMNNLANSLSNQGKYNRAEKIYRQALVLKEKILGKEHPETLQSMNNLANSLSGQGKYEQVEEIHRQALVLREKILGKEHPETLLSMNNLASSLGGQGKYEQAEEIYRQALVLKEKILGKEHPETLWGMNNLANSLSCQGSYEQAEEIYQQALRLREAVSGKEHPDTLMAVHGLATVLENTHRFAQADRHYERALTGLEKALGSNHPVTISCRKRRSSLHNKIHNRRDGGYRCSHFLDLGLTHILAGVVAMFVLFALFQSSAG